MWRENNAEKPRGTRRGALIILAFLGLFRACSRRSKKLEQRKPLILKGKTPFF
jgi:hypothetical protein